VKTLSRSRVEIASVWAAILFFVLLSLSEGCAKRTEGFGGRYHSQTTEADIILVLCQKEETQVEGEVLYRGELWYRLEGEIAQETEGFVKKGQVFGVCYEGETSAFFQVEREADHVLLNIIQSGPDSFPDFSTLRQWVFIKID